MLGVDLRSMLIPKKLTEIYVSVLAEHRILVNVLEIKMQ
jgi:hypothetical protein